MAEWILIPCLVQLREEFNKLAPSRDKASDGSIGDTTHQEETSDHNADEVGSVPIRDADSKNEVHAIDVDTDFRVPGLTMERVVQFLLGRCRSGAEKRLRYIIYYKRIWEADNDWRERKYTGPSPHTEHAHFSASYITAREASTASWHLEDIPVALTAEDKQFIGDKIESVLEAKLADIFGLDRQKDGTPTSEIGNAVLAQGIPNGMKQGAPRSTAWEVLRDLGVGVAGIQTTLNNSAKAKQV